MRNVILSPSILAADFCRLGDAVKKIEQIPGSWIHIDIMDGHFVPNISFGTMAVKAVRAETTRPLDVHLMVCEPEKHIAAAADAGADYITFHYESSCHHSLLIQRIHSFGKKAGVAVNPSTPVRALEEILADADLILIMTVNPGVEGQSLLPACLSKIEKLARIRQEGGFSFLISADGGVNAENFGRVKGCGADVIVSGSSFFSGGLSQYYSY